MYLDITGKTDFSSCQFPLCDKGVKITDKDIKEKSLMICDKKDDWSDFSYLQIKMYSENASGTVIAFCVLTDKKEDGSYGGYMHYVTVSWSGERVITCPLKYGIVTHNNPTKGLDNVLGIMVKPFYGGVTPGKTEVYIDRIWVTNEPLKDRERFIECDENEEYFVEGLKNQKIDAISMLKEHSKDKKHPRLIMTEKGFSDLKRYANDIDFVKDSYIAVKEKADKALEKDIPKYERLDGRRLSRDVCSDIMNLLFAYIIDGDKKYKDKIRENVLALCKYPDWNPSHDIDVGDMARPVAFAYDWLYNEWTDKEKRIMRNAMLKNGFEAMITPIRENVGYAADHGNHNTVTITGLGMLALAIGDEEGCEDISNEIINATIECIPKNLKTFAPYGVCTEGAGYWAYGQDNFYLYHAAMCQCLRTDFGFGELSGMDTTADYLIAMHGAKGKTFNYADAHDKDENCLSASLLWLATYYNKKEYAKEYIKSNNKSYLNLMYFKDGMQDFDDEEQAQVDKFLGNVGSMKRGSGADELYLGFKGGKIEPHCDLDFGTFVFDALGERFVSDLGREPYDMPGMWEYHKNAGRWSYYRKRAEGNNCIVINPKYDPENFADQSIEADCNIISSESNSECSYAEFDLTSAYPEYAKKVTRRFSLTEKGMELKDSLELKEASEVYSFIHTKAEVSISEDGSFAKMTVNEKNVICRLKTDADFKLIVMPAEPLTEEFKKLPHNDNSAYKKIAVYGENIKNAQIIITIEVN